MRRTLGALLAATVLVAAGACEPTGSAACDGHPDVIAVADRIGYTINCDPPFPPHRDEVSGAMNFGWADHAHRTLYVWPDYLSSDGAVWKILWHEEYHAEAYVHGWPNLECRAEQWAYDHMGDGHYGVGFTNRCT